MKLRNKKTGEIGELITENYEFDGFWVRTGGDNYPDYKDINYYSLAELNEEWEDVEEPKAYWYIDDAGVMQVDQILSSKINMRKAIGNYFKTEEEAEKAVEKLRAWKRLKDKGFKFNGYHIPAGEIYFGMEIPKDSLDKIAKDFTFLFGGEE